MTAGHFVLDTRLEADTAHVASLPLCEVLLMNDARYPWLILVPRRNKLVEIFDLDAGEQAVLWQETSRAASALKRSACRCDKLNIAALGNIVSQLHVHLVLRRNDDHAWPAPVWGLGARIGYENEPMLALVQSLKTALAS